MNFQVIVTIGPSVLDPEVLREIHGMGKCIYRINGAHADSKTAEDMYFQVKEIIADAEVMMDLPGNKVRTAGFAEPLQLKKGGTFELSPEQLNYKEFYKLLKPGQMIKANDSILTLEVTGIEGDRIVILSHSDGLLANNKGIHVQGVHGDLPFLFERDQELIDTACKLNMEFLSLSFVRTAADIQEVKEILRSRNNQVTKLISKIETAAAVENLGYILHEVDYINVDRGDLSTDVGMLKLPLIQERIVESAHRSNTDVFLATQFLKNMETKPIPLIAEVIDLYKTFRTGVNGIQLSEETAVGKYPVQCVKQVFDLFNASFAY